MLHRSGAVIIESKSVTSAVRINERSEWARAWNGRWSGMPSRRKTLQFKAFRYHLVRWQ